MRREAQKAESGAARGCTLGKNGHGMAMAPVPPTLLFGPLDLEFPPHSLGGILGLHPQFQSLTDTLLSPLHFCFTSLVRAGAPPLSLAFTLLEGPNSPL